MALKSMTFASPVAATAEGLIILAPRQGELDGSSGDSRGDHEHDDDTNDDDRHCPVIRNYRSEREPRLV